MKDRLTNGSCWACARAAIRNQAIPIDESGRGSLREFGVTLSAGVGAITIGGARTTYRAVAAARAFGPAGVVLITFIAFGDAAFGSIETAVEAIACIILEAKTLRAFWAHARRSRAVSKRAVSTWKIEADSTSHTASSI